MHSDHTLTDRGCDINGEPDMAATSTPDLAIDIVLYGSQAGTHGLRQAKMPGRGLELTRDETHDLGAADLGGVDHPRVVREDDEEGSVGTYVRPAIELTPPESPEVEPTDVVPAPGAVSPEGPLGKPGGSDPWTDGGPSGDEGPGSPEHPRVMEAAGPDSPGRSGRGAAKSKATKTTPSPSRGKGGKPSVGKVAGAAEGPKGRASSQGVETVAADNPVREIKDEQTAQYRHGGVAVAGYILIGVKLTALKATSGRTWGKRLVELGYSARVASRLQKLGKAWGGEIGRIGPDLFPSLPNDFNKLEWLCRLDAERLRHLLAKLDAKKAGRRAIVAEVRSALGEGPAAPRPESFDSLAGSIDRMFEHLTDRLGKVDGIEAEGLGHRLRDILTAGVSRVESSLGTSTAGDAAGGTMLPNDGAGIIPSTHKTYLYY